MGCVSRFEGTSCEEREQLFKAQRAWCPCRYEAEPLPCKVSDWKVEGKCTKVCGGGTLKKTREILRPALNGGACAVEMESEDSCNEHDCEEKFHTQDAKCPAPYDPMSKEQCEHRAHEHNQKDFMSVTVHNLPAGCIFYTLRSVYLWNAVEQGVGHERFERVCALETPPRKLTPESVYVSFRFCFCVQILFFHADSVSTKITFIDFMMISTIACDSIYVDSVYHGLFRSAVLGSIFDFIQYLFCFSLSLPYQAAIIQYL